MPNGNGLKNLFIPRDANDTGARPYNNSLEPVWECTSLKLDTTNGAIDESTYDPSKNAPCGILVTVENANPRVQFQSVTVEVWLTDPTTLVAPAGRLKLNLTTNQSSASQTTPPNPVPVTFPANFNFATDFVPYPGISATGHVCLIANCYGTTMDNQSEGTDYIDTNPNAATFDTSGDAHHAQHNIFAKAASKGSNKILDFAFNAASALEKGHEDVHLEIVHLTPPTGLSARDLAFLHNGPYKHLPFHSGTFPVKDYLIHGCHGGPNRHGTLRIGAGNRVPLKLDVHIDHRETKGAVHAFDVIQKGADGHVQGGLRLLAVVDH